MNSVAAEFTVLGEARRGVFRYDQKTFQVLARQLRDGHYEVHVARLQANRSPQANRYYWGVVIGALADHTGYTPNELHELLKMKFLPKSLALTDGNGEIKGEFVMGGSTRALTVGEFHRYVDDVRRFAAEALGVETPDPGGA